MMKAFQITNLFTPLLLVLLLTSCEKEKDYIYEVNPVNVQQGGSTKNNAKSTVEFVTIAWADLFGTQIPQQELVKLNTVYSSFGDKKLIEDRILLNLLNKPGIQVPSATNVNGDTLKFIQNTYKKLYNRSPDAFEQYYMKEQIRLNTAISATVIWYALMSADEYRYY
ncbi:MAG: hypothetical protein IPJ86_08675 [Bacteroidetes bacterium]|nr:hypothetical protein [Bacteroidota bacterium]